MENYELKFLEEQIYRKKAKIPKGKKKIISCRLYPDSNNIFWINDVLKKYSTAVLFCSWHFTGHGFKYIQVKNSISPRELTRLEREFGLIVLNFRFTVIGESTKLIDKFRPSNWFLT